MIESGGNSYSTPWIAKVATWVRRFFASYAGVVWGALLASDDPISVKSVGENESKIDLPVPIELMTESVSHSADLDDWVSLPGDAYERNADRLSVRFDPSSESSFFQIRAFGSENSDFSLIPAGSFMMGSPESELGRDDDETLREVTISKPFYMSRREVALGDFLEVIEWAVDLGLAGQDQFGYWVGDHRLDTRIPIGFKSFGSPQCYLSDAGDYGNWLETGPADCDDLPVAYVTWKGAVAYANFRSLREGREPCYDFTDWSCDFSKSGYRLPTEAEWEYACRAETDTAFYTGEIANTLEEPVDPSLDAAGWYSGNVTGTIIGNLFQLGGAKQPNAFGLYDMHGNVPEWCWDWYGDYADGPQVDPRGPAEGTEHVARGGGVGYLAKDCRSASRLSIVSGHSGFRVVINPSPIALGADIATVDLDGDGVEGVTLDGSASENLRGSIVSWNWSWEGGNASGEFAETEFPLGETEVSLTITSEQGETAVDLVSVNVHKIANAGPDVSVVDVGGDGVQEVVLDASRSLASDEVESWVWSWEGGSAIGETTSGVFPVGDTIVTLIVTSNQGIESQDELIVSVTPESDGFALIPAGSFVIGSPEGESGRRENEVQRDVTISKPFYMSVTEVTHAQMVEVMQWAFKEGYLDVIETGVMIGDNPLFGRHMRLYTDSSARPIDNQVSFYQGEFSVVDSAENLPMVDVSWYGAVAYAHFRSLMEGRESCYDLTDWSCDFSKSGYRVPTSAEWEYACRAGTTGRFHTTPGQELGDIAWFDDNSEGRTHEVGTKQPNAWGLFDMHGNALEWCWDGYAEYPPGELVDPVLDGFSFWILRGGSVDREADDCRSAYMEVSRRETTSFGDFVRFLGFRVVFNPPGE